MAKRKLPKKEPVASMAGLLKIAEGKFKSLAEGVALLRQRQTWFTIASTRGWGAYPPLCKKLC